MSEQVVDRPFGNDGPWLSKRKDSPNWYICWYAEHKTTQRESTRTSDLTKARKMLASWWTTKRLLRHTDPAAVPLAMVLDRYCSNHARRKKSKTQAKVAIAKFKKFFAGATAAELTRTAGGVHRVIARRWIFAELHSPHAERW